MNIISNKLIKIAKMIQSSVTLQHDIENYIINKVKRNSNDKYYSTTNFNSQQLSQLLKQNTSESLTIYIVNYNILFKEYENKKRIYINRQIKQLIYQSIGCAGGFSDEIDRNGTLQHIITVFFDEQLYSRIVKDKQLQNYQYISNNIKTINTSFDEIKSVLKHQLIHFYKTIKNLDQFKLIADSYYSSKQEYDSWINDLKYELIKKITNIQIENNKVTKVQINNNLITLKDFVNNCLNKKHFDKRFINFVQTLDSNKINDLINEIEKTLLYQYNNKNIYNNIEQAFNDISKNYFTLYKAINKNLINDKNKIYQVVQQIIANNKIYLIVDLIKNNKINKDDKQLLELINNYKNNKDIYKNLVVNDLIISDADFVINYIKNNDYIYNYIEQNQYDLNKQQLILLIDKYKQTADYEDVIQLINNIQNKDIRDYYNSKLNFFKTIENYNIYKPGFQQDDNRQLNKKYNVTTIQHDVDFYINKNNNPYCVITKHNNIQMCHNTNYSNTYKIDFIKEHNQIILNINNEITPPTNLNCKYDKQNNIIEFYNRLKTRKAIYNLKNNYCQLFVQDKLYTDNKQDDIGTNLFTYNQLFKNNSNIQYFKTIDEYVKEQTQYNQRISKQYQQIKSLLTQLYCK